MTADEYRIVLSPAWFGRTRADLYYTSHAPSGPQLLARMRARTAERAQAEATSLAGAIQARDGHGSPYWVVVE